MSDEQPVVADGFRPRRKRTKAQMQQLIKDGWVRDPNAPPAEDVVYPDDVTVFAVPVAAHDAEGKDVT